MTAPLTGILRKLDEGLFFYSFHIMLDIKCYKCSLIPDASKAHPLKESQRLGCSRAGPFKLVPEDITIQWKETLIQYNQTLIGGNK